MGQSARECKEGSLESTKNAAALAGEKATKEGNATLQKHTFPTATFATSAAAASWSNPVITSKSAAVVSSCSLLPSSSYPISIPSPLGVRRESPLPLPSDAGATSPRCFHRRPTVHARSARHPELSVYAVQICTGEPQGGVTGSAVMHQ